MIKWFQFCRHVFECIFDPNSFDNDGDDVACSKSELSWVVEAMHRLMDEVSTAFEVVVWAVLELEY